MAGMEQQMGMPSPGGGGKPPPGLQMIQPMPRFLPPWLQQPGTDAGNSFGPWAPGTGPSAGLQMLPQIQNMIGLLGPTDMSGAVGQPTDMSMLYGQPPGFSPGLTDMQSGYRPSGQPGKKPGQTDMDS